MRRRKRRCVAKSISFKLARTRLAVSLAALLIAVLSASAALWLTLVEQQALPCDDVAAWIRAHEAADDAGPAVIVRLNVNAVQRGTGAFDADAAANAADVNAWATALITAGDVALSRGELRVVAHYTIASRRRGTDGLGYDAAVYSDAVVDVNFATACDHAGALPELSVAGDGAMRLSGLPCGAGAATRSHIASAVIAAVDAALYPLAVDRGELRLSPARHAAWLRRRGPDSPARPPAAAPLRPPRRPPVGIGPGAGDDDDGDAAPWAGAESVHVEVAVLVAEPRVGDGGGCSSGSDDVPPQPSWHAAAAADAAARVAALARDIGDLAHVTTASRTLWYGALGDEAAVVEATAMEPVGPSCSSGGGGGGGGGSGGGGSGGGVAGPGLRRVHYVEPWALRLFLASNDADLLEGGAGVEMDVPGGADGVPGARIVLVDGGEGAPLEAGAACSCWYVADVTDAPPGGVGADSPDFGLGRTGMEVAANVAAAAAAGWAAVRAMAGSAPPWPPWPPPTCGRHNAVDCDCGRAERTAASLLRACVVGATNGVDVKWALGFVPPPAYTPLFVRAPPASTWAAAAACTGTDVAACTAEAEGLWILPGGAGFAAAAAGDDDAVGTADACRLCAAARAGTALTTSFSVDGWGRVALLDDGRGLGRDGRESAAGADVEAVAEAVASEALAAEAVAVLRSALGLLPHRPRSTFVVVTGDDTDAQAEQHPRPQRSESAGAGPEVVAAAHLSSAAVAADGGTTAASDASANFAAAAPSPADPRHSTAAVRVTLLQPSDAIAALTALERAALRRAWWGVHLHATLSTLAAACDTFGPRALAGGGVLAEAWDVGVAALGGAVAPRTGGAGARYRVTRRDVEAMRASLASLAVAVDALRPRSDADASAENRSCCGADGCTTDGAPPSERQLTASLIALRRARIAAALLLQSADAPAPDSYMPLSHAAAVFLPAWAPLVLPLLFAVWSACAGLWAKRGQRGKRDTG